jgi:biopolymer transport protein ExbD
MRYKKKEFNVTAEPDMTPMIDMTFQLIIFFMVVLNFGEGEQDARITLPESELAKPPEGPVESPLTLQLTRRGTVYYAADELSLAALAGPLRLERQLLERRQRSPADATVIIRADTSAKTGVVQELIKICQENGFEKFKLRIKQKREGEPEP